MAFRFVVLLALVAGLSAAPTGQNSQQGPPIECEKPFGDGKLATDASPYTFTITALQRAAATDYKKTFKGAPIDFTITFSAPAGTPAIQAFALRAGIPFPVVQWQKSTNQMAKVISCIAPQSVDTLLVKGNIGTSQSAVAVPLLAAWANHQTMPVVYEMAIQGGNGQIYVSAFNGSITVQETDYVLPKQFFQPPANSNAQRGASGITNMNDPRFQSQGGQQQFPRQRRDDGDDVQADQVQEDDEDGN